MKIRRVINCRIVGTENTISSVESEKQKLDDCDYFGQLASEIK